MRSGGQRLCLPGSILVNLAFIKARLLYHPRVPEMESWIKVARYIGASADERPEESIGSYKVDMMQQNAWTTGEKVEKADTTITGGRTTSV
ncbi:hypothetical protein NDU88_006344 [Pleurodeles waltl]|uniref:Uncharacterized protein n=1 Tax=Pleurodeles waltl TaxID=8319 RepID=A0AAV7VPH4_PLEWA|nr:hypothetical protein NDU88_006344 [Pleurodeles waltl]